MTAFAGRQRTDSRPSGVLPGGLVLLLLVVGCGDTDPGARHEVRGSARDLAPPSVVAKERPPLVDPGYLHYTFRGPAPQRRHWRVQVDGRGGRLPEAALRAATKTALTLWNEALRGLPGEPRFELVAPSAPHDLLVGWDRGDREVSSLFHPVHEALARTAPLGETSWIRLDAALRWGESRQPELLPVLIHEFGHVFGLDHSLDPRSVMHASYDERRRQLGASDHAGLAAIFGGADSGAPNGETLVLTDRGVTPPRRHRLPGAARGKTGAALVDLDRDGRPEVLLRHPDPAGGETWTLHRPQVAGWGQSLGPVRPPLPLGERGLIDLDEDDGLIGLRFDARGRYARVRFDADEVWGGVAPPGSFRLRGGLTDADGNGSLDVVPKSLAAYWPPRAADGVAIVLPEERGAETPRFTLTRE